MTISFDLYTHRNKLYCRMIRIAIIGFVVAAICLYATNFLESFKFLYGLLAAVVVIYVLFIAVVVLIVIGYGALQTYEKDGELILSDDEVTIDGIQIRLNTTEKIHLKLRPRTNRSGWRLIGNRVEVIDSNGKIYKRFFSINSYEHNDQLFQMLNAWDEKGVKYTQDYTTV